MTKQELQKELLEKVKPGTKPSDFRKLKRSKSDSDIPKALPLPPTELETELKKSTDLNLLLSEQLQEKQKEVEELRKQLESNPTELANSLISRHKSLKDWFTQYSRNKELDQELTENVEQASNELTSQAQTISSLRSENSKLKKTNQSLQKDLELVQRLAESRKVPYYPPEDNGTYLKYALYSLLAVSFTLWLVKGFKNVKENPNYD